jgi:hypothetical protein
MLSPNQVVSPNLSIIKERPAVQKKTNRTAKLTDLPFLVDIRAKADRALHEADEVYILGWSFPETDTDHRTRIEEIMRKRDRIELPVQIRDGLRFGAAGEMPEWRA